MNAIGFAAALIVLCLLAIWDAGRGKGRGA